MHLDAFKNIKKYNWYIQLTIVKKLFPAAVNLQLSYHR